MEAAKRMYDNSYNERQETVALAKAYLDAPKTGKSVETETVKVSRPNFFCNALSIVMSIGYCFVILVLLLIPLIRETQLAQLKVEEYTYKVEIARLEQQIKDVQFEFQNKLVLDNLETEAKEKLGLIRKQNGEEQVIRTSRYYTLEDARDAYYNTNYELSSSDQ
ncbi:MAG: hypothetical protein JEZ08_05665 [Clostridiales bacterium]|nr:hypothetical protein [Clostridiales bacterium]